MKIQPFKVEEWMNANETRARYNIAETCVDSVSLDELFQLTNTDGTSFFQDFRISSENPRLFNCRDESAE